MSNVATTIPGYAVSGQTSSSDIEGVGAWITTGAIMGSTIRTGTCVIEVPRITMQMLTEHPAFTSSVDELVNMWLIRYGADWVKCEDIDEEFYKLAYTRLKQFGRIEEFYISDMYVNVVRVIGGK